MPIPPRPLVKQEMNRVITGFFEFFQKYSVLPLAIGVVIGTAVNDLVKSVVDGIISPLIALVTPGTTLKTYEVTFHGSVFKIGAAADAFLNFFIIALLIYIVVKLVLRREDVLPPK